ncbi:DDE-type integrase/transposase/recombinase [Aliiglaciecola sp. NS0011-25]|uniref:DDE-type integrase/transposase/recombinase n=1 Tax=Aliiglaciecola sp. NS0011-25 TaxID=3127654 RepID=UPI0033428FEA
MKKIGLKGCPRKRCRRFSQEPPSYPLADNLLSRQFNVDKPNTVWSSDITYVQTRQGALYLAVVMDLFSKRIVV